MILSMKYQKLSHAVYYCDYHIVVGTKYRKAWINPGVFAYLELKLKEVVDYHPDLFIKTVNHDSDHIHVLISIPPKYSVSSIVRIIKCNTAVGLKQKFPFFKTIYWGTTSVWSDGYFVSTVGINEKTIKQYIENQGQEDTAQASLELG